MKTLRRSTSANITVPLIVAAGLAADDFVKVGASTLRGVLVTDRATADTIAKGTSAPGLKEGEASVELIGVHTTVKATVAAATAVGTPFYFDANGDLTITAAGNTLVGAGITATTGPGTVEVALY